MHAKLDIFPASSAHWQRYLRNCPHHFYHTAAYHRFSEESGEGEARLAVCCDGDRFLAWPYLLRRVSGVQGLEGSDLRDITSVYGYPGPLFSGCVPGDAFVESAWVALRERWREDGIVTVFTRFNPLLANQGDPQSKRSFASGLMPHGRTISIDLAPGPGEYWGEYRKSLRKNINRCRRLGCVTELDETWQHFADFLLIYQRTMVHNVAPTSYQFAGDYFRRLRQALGERLHLMVTKLGGRVGAACLFVEDDATVHAHLGGTHPRYRELSPFKVLLDDARRWAHQRGHHTLHLGGGRGGAEDKLFAFKAAFSPRRHDFYTGRWILEPEAYRDLCAQRNTRATIVGIPVEANGYFPAYRAPTVPLTRVCTMV